jgi:Ca2+ transporting ATPase
MMVLLVVLFFGPNFIPEGADGVDAMINEDWSVKYNDASRSSISSGIYRNIFNGNVQTSGYGNYRMYSRHFTVIFNLYVLMQFVNYFNCHSIGEKSFTFFSLLNIPTIVCILLAIGLHILALFHGREVLQIYPGGLTFEQWAICLGLSLLVVLVAILTRELPL